MTGVVLLYAALIAAHLPSAPQESPRADALEAFGSLCLAETASGVLSERAIAAGYLPIPLMAEIPGWRETAAWQKNDLRLLNLSSGTASNPDQQLCGITAAIGKLDDDNMLLD